MDGISSTLPLIANILCEYTTKVIVADTSACVHGVYIIRVVVYSEYATAVSDPARVKYDIRFGRPTIFEYLTRTRFGKICGVPNFIRICRFCKIYEKTNFA